MEVIRCEQLPLLIYRCCAHLPPVCLPSTRNRMLVTTFSMPRCERVRTCVVGTKRTNMHSDACARDSTNPACWDERLHVQEYNCAPCIGVMDVCWMVTMVDADCDWTVTKHNNVAVWLSSVRYKAAYGPNAKVLPRPHVVHVRYLSTPSLRSGFCSPRNFQTLETGYLGGFFSAPDLEIG